jgi:lipoic acid synthetase
MEPGKRKPKPQWLKTAIPGGENYFKIKKALEKRNLCTICQSARCPNISECWNNYHATFLIMGNTCSRDCTFCSVKHGVPESLDTDEPGRVLEMTRIMKTKYVVITSVTRDDLEDGGSSHFAAVINTLGIDP